MWVQCLLRQQQGAAGQLPLSNATDNTPSNDFKLRLPPLGVLAHMQQADAAALHGRVLWPHAAAVQLLAAGGL